ncbi:hypothetical protein [Sporosarcina jiandibaonis]|uniref:hypothetical protein n=1 Tax=Sporosarcina jiandibaonis TaxID=2715535 RepID=UPI001551A79D|nr:hypothetical protein [Sporosarcina jiandibaonis]
MKSFGRAMLATVILYLITIFLVAPIMSNIGYSSVESSYHLQTHALIVTFIFTVILCTLLIVEKIIIGKK